MQYGVIRLVKNSLKEATAGVLPSVFIEKPESRILHNAQATAIGNLAFGQVNEPEDLSASIKSFWDEQNLYLFTEIKDNVARAIDSAEIKQASAFYDYGYIENSAGEVIWQMQNYYTEHAGGALKNRLADTVIPLKAGRYHIKYVTDESHSWNNWDDTPPQTPFYGIVVYKKE